MRKLMIGVLILALCGTVAIAQNIQPNQNTTADGDPATATLEVGLSVAKYAEVTWNNPTAAYGDLGFGVVDPQIELTGPVGRVWDVNFYEVPIHLRSNCDVTLTLAEGVSQALRNAGVPKQAFYDPEVGGWGSQVYEAILVLGDPLQAAGTSVDGIEYIGNNAGPNEGVTHFHNRFEALPGDAGEGLTGALVFKYGGEIRQIGGQWNNNLMYNGSFESHVKVGVATFDSVVQDDDSNDWSWTDLGVGTAIADAYYYATISVDND
ncbi:MAG: hypothetical protein ACOX9R_16640 [Armatimonadota bacterium]